MKLKSLYSFLLATALVACNEDFNEGIAGIQTADPESPAAAVTFSATAASATTIDLGALAEGTTTVKVCSFTATPSTETTTVTHVLDLRDAENNSYDVELNANGEAAVADLQAVIESVYNKRPVERTFDAYVYEFLNTDGQSLIGKSEKITVIMTPKAPVIESAYYYIGQTNGWTPGDASAEYKFSHSGQDVYEDPIFTITVKAPYGENAERIDMWFKIVPQSAMDAFETGGADAFWNAGLLGSDTKDGDDRTEANLLAGGGSFVQSAEDEAKFYTITLDMLEYSMKVEPLKYDEYIYIPGNHQVGVAGAESWGWTLSVAPALWSPGCDGIYTGYSYLDGGFKFTRNRENWDGEYNSSHFNEFSEGLGDDGGNITMSTAGFYHIEADMQKKTLTATETNWVIIGAVTGDTSWGTVFNMTYDNESEAWVYTGDLVPGEFKFRGDDAWKFNVGGSFDNLEQDGGNLVLEEAGNYTVKLYLTRSKSDKMYCTLTKN